MLPGCSCSHPAAALDSSIPPLLGARIRPTHGHLWTNQKALPPTEAHKTARLSQTHREITEGFHHVGCELHCTWETAGNCLAK
ncbi:hypothetical protein AAY473_025991 [Plecturocebus cupreus]